MENIVSKEQVVTESPGTKSGRQSNVGHNAGLSAQTYLDSDLDLINLNFLLFHVLGDFISG